MKSISTAPNSSSGKFKSNPIDKEFKEHTENGKRAYGCCITKVLVLLAC
jgi:hypothetical protein